MTSTNTTSVAFDSALKSVSDLNVRLYLKSNRCEFDKINELFTSAHQHVGDVHSDIKSKIVTLWNNITNAMVQFVNNRYPNTKELVDVCRRSSFMKAFSQFSTFYLKEMNKVNTPVVDTFVEVKVSAEEKTKVVEDFGNFIHRVMCKPYGQSA